MEMLPDDTLLNIFRHYLDATPQIWPTLVWVCQRWRRIVLTSPLGLNLRLYCTYGRPVLKALGHWLALPIIMEYGGVPNLDPPATEDDDNIMAALKLSGRISSISLTVTSSLLEKLSAISESFSELEELVLLSQDNMQLTLPGSFRWGPHLRTLHSTRIGFPSFPQLLLPSQNLIDLQLHEVPISGYFSPESFVNALSGMTQLRSLSLHFITLPPRRNYLALPPQLGERVVLPALASLKYRGTSKYMDNFVARIDAPRLGNIGITFFSQPTMDASQLGRFVERMQTSPSQAEVEISAHAISISFTNSSAATPLRLQISCKQLNWQLSSLAQLCGQFSQFLFHIQNLGINTTESPSGQNDVDGEQWLGLLHSFGSVRDLYVAGELAAEILCALCPADGGHTANTTALPTLRCLRVRTSKSTGGPFRDAALSFFTSRRLSGRPVELEFLCHICDTCFKRQEELRAHLIDKHAHRIVCSYCDDFERKPGNDHLFRDHLESKHPDIARKDELFSNPFSTLDGLVNRHSSLRPSATSIPMFNEDFDISMIPPISIEVPKFDAASSATSLPMFDPVPQPPLSLEYQPYSWATAPDLWVGGSAPMYNEDFDISMIPPISIEIPKFDAASSATSLPMFDPVPQSPLSLEYQPYPRATAPDLWVGGGAPMYNEDFDISMIPPISIEVPKF
jgi:hypothetical protein